jgi:primosomal protein N' (replication factor Y)
VKAVRVILPLPLDQAYTYLVPPELAAAVRPGVRVLVPFGPRRLTGLVVDAAAGQEVPEDRLRPLLDVLDERPAFTDELLRLTHWMADYYVCAWGEAIKAALPAGTDIEDEHRIVRTDMPATSALTPKERTLLRVLEQGGETTLDALRQQVRGVHLASLRALEQAGLVRLEAALTTPKVRIKHERYVRLAPAFAHGSAPRDLAVLLRGTKQVAVVEALGGFLLEGRKEPRLAEVLARAGATGATVQTLVAKGIVEVVEREVLRTPLGDWPDEPAPIRTLHPAQQAALQPIQEALAARRFQTFLLHGVTGSGKTEVYIAALKETLAQGRTGIILVPEIALTPQTVRRFRAHFGDRIAVLHSRMSLGERYDAWRHLRDGRFQVVIGPRSAILAPLSDVGLVVVDEEHEPSYKQFDPAPRYHARDVAVMRAHLHHAVCVLGSATPSLESYTNARWGKYTLLEMRQRVPVPGLPAAPLPTVEVVDLTLERKKHRLDGVFSERLCQAIQQRLDRREQAILLQNRRGYAPVVECASCGWSPRCPDCAVTLTYHRPRHELRCHYCGRVERLRRTCRNCQQDDLTLLGTGTQRVEEELTARFPEIRVLRMDLDTTGRKDAHHTLLDRFGRGEADVLLGTQMVAKGLDFGRVTLVGVVNADVGLLLPDFRADERIFQLLTQVAGRAGRAGLRGEVILQTRNPGHKVLQFAARHDYEGFAETALPERQPMHWPPYGRLVGIEFRGPKDAVVAELAQAWTTTLRHGAGEMVQVLGPEAAFVGRIQRQYRYQTFLRAPRGVPSGELQRLLRQTLARFGPPPKACHISIDVDAVGLF